MKRGKEGLDALISQRAPSYFILIGELDEQPDLKEALGEYRIIVATNGYRIYSLEKNAPSR
jgi:hypothetical protein